MHAALAHPADLTRVAQAWAVLAQIPDPEVPAVTLCDLGMVRSVQEVGEVLEVALTPTYSGCPATEMIEQGVIEGLRCAGLGPVQTRLQRAPAWTTDWITPEGRAKLRAYGIAPPGQVQPHESITLRFVPRAQYQQQRDQAQAGVACPRCGSAQTERLSTYGSTACKALYRCMSCSEPFEYFKPI
ncbi:MAG: 1,2-phenylacetyl-CoA epoxidase subunit PaaD [Comamonas sp.]